ncbi:MAG: uroporphyrinogen-III synthase [Arcobacteraceae bacterium]
MKNFNKLIYDLNLLYYEYDKFTNKLVVDKSYSKQEVYKEFIKTTYSLTKNNIQFFIDEKQDIVLFNKDTLITRLKQRCINLITGLKNQNKNIYILSDKSVQYAKNLPMIDTIPIQMNIDCSKYDALIFTSKNAIKYLNELSNDWKHIPSYVIAPQTAKTLKDYKGTLQFTGSEKHGNEFAYEIIPLLANKKVLYIGGNKTVSNLVTILNNNNVICDYKAIYKTITHKYPQKVKLPKNSIVIFSSPSTIKSFFQNSTWDKSYTAISIGKTTAKYLPKDINPIISEITSLKGCVQTALNL